MTTEQQSRRCHRCGEPLAVADLAGNCLHCLSALLLLPESADGVESSPSPVIRRLGDYELLEEVARGGMGVVFRARQVSLDRTVAVKVLRDAWLATPIQVKRFRAEAANAAKLKHPNIVAVHEVGEQDGQHYFTMDLIQGMNLAEATHEGPLPSRRAAELVRKVAGAVQHAHQEGVLHRDVKPSNVLLDAQGEPHVTDFGLARPLDGESSLTLTGQVLGTPGYMAPEQARGSSSVGPAGDVYGLGALLFHLLTGRAPFVGASAAETLTQVLQQEPLSPRLLNPAVPVDLAAVCLKCVRKPPRERYGSAGELAADLKRFLDGHTTQARPAGSIERTVRWARRKPALAAMVLALHLAVGLGLVGVVWQWREATAARVAAETARQRAEAELWSSRLTQARAENATRAFGRRQRALTALAAAARQRPSLDLRNEAMTALLMPDLGRRLSWRDRTTLWQPLAYDSALDHYADYSEAGEICIRRSADHQRVASIRNSQSQPFYLQFSPDDRWLGLQLEDGNLEVWDWRKQQRLAQRSGVKSQFGVPTFDYSPDSRTLVYLPSNQPPARLEILSGVELAPLALNFDFRLVRFDPSGRRLALVGKEDLHVVDLEPHRLTSRLPLAGSVFALAWHPHGEQLAISIYGRGLFIWDLDQAEARHLGRNDPAFTRLHYSPTGDSLVAGGWHGLTQIWDVASEGLLAEGPIGYAVQGSRDGRRLAVNRERIGHGVWEILPRCGLTKAMVPPSLAGSMAGPRLDSRGRWLLIGHASGCLLWDATTGHVVAKTQGAEVMDAMFTPASPDFLTASSNGVWRWPVLIPPSDETPQLGQPVREGRFSLEELEGATFSADGRQVVGYAKGQAECLWLDGTRAPLRWQLLNASDRSFKFSLDGHWIASSRHNKGSADVWDLRDGTLATTLKPGDSTLFEPSGQLVLNCALSGTSAFRLGTWESTACPSWANTGSWLGAPPRAGFGVFVRDGFLRLHDLAADQDSVCIPYWSEFQTWEASFDASGQRFVLRGPSPALSILDLGILRSELAKLGLDW